MTVHALTYSESLHLSCLSLNTHILSTIDPVNSSLICSSVCPHKSPLCLPWWLFSNPKSTNMILRKHKSEPATLLILFSNSALPRELQASSKAQPPPIVSLATPWRQAPAASKFAVSDVDCAVFTFCAFMYSVTCLQCVYHLLLTVCYPPLGLVSVLVSHLLGSMEPSSMNFLPPSLFSL